MLAMLKALPLAQKIGIGLLVLAFVATGIAIVNHFIDKAFDSATTAGATAGAAKAAEKGLTNVEAANTAAIDVSRDPDIRYFQCLHTSRTPENC